jgi:hypothetical protein
MVTAALVDQFRFLPLGKYTVEPATMGLRLGAPGDLVGGVRAIELLSPEQGPNLPNQEDVLRLEYVLLP